MSRTIKTTSGVRPLETFLALAGIGLLAGGALHGSAIGLFWGAVTLGGLALLHLVRKKDWEKHWAEQGGRNGYRQD